MSFGKSAPYQLPRLMWGSQWKSLKFDPAIPKCLNRWWPEFALVITAKPFMLACPLFCEIKGSKYQLQAKIQDAITAVFRIVWFLFAKIKGAKIILHRKSPTFRVVKLKGFAVDHRHLPLFKISPVLFIFWGVSQFATDNVAAPVSCWYVKMRRFTQGCSFWGSEKNYILTAFSQNRKIWTTGWGIPVWRRGPLSDSCFLKPWLRLK